MENNRNFFITIALSVLILTLWQVFYMNPRIEAEREAAKVAAGTGRGRKEGGGARESGVAGGDVPRAAARHGARRRRRRPRRRDPRRGDRRQPARQDRHAEPFRLDQPDRRAHRRRQAEALPRDRRRRLRPPSNCSTRRACPTATSPRSASSATPTTGAVPGAGNGLDRRGQPDADAVDARDAHLHQRKGPDLQAHHRGRRELHVHRVRHRDQRRRGSGLAVELRPRHALRQADHRLDLRAA